MNKIFNSLHILIQLTIHRTKTPFVLVHAEKWLRAKAIDLLVLRRLPQFDPTNTLAVHNLLNQQSSPKARPVEWMRTNLAIALPCLRLWRQVLKVVVLTLLQDSKTDSDALLLHVWSTSMDVELSLSRWNFRKAGSKHRAQKGSWNKATHVDVSSPEASRDNCWGHRIFLDVHQEFDIYFHPLYFDNQRFLLNGRGRRKKKILCRMKIYFSNFSEIFAYGNLFMNIFFRFAE